MKRIILIIPCLMIVYSCSGPKTPPTTPIQPPTVETDSTPTTTPNIVK